MTMVSCFLASNHQLSADRRLSQESQVELAHIWGAKRTRLRNSLHFWLTARCYVSTEMANTEGISLYRRERAGWQEQRNGLPGCLSAVSLSLSPSLPALLV